MPIKFKKNKNWKIFEQALDSSKYRSLAQNNIKVATGQLALYIQGQVRRSIKNREYEANHPLTDMIKEGKTAPLVDTSRTLWNGIAVDLIDWNKAFVGVKKTEGIYNIAVTLHEGNKIKVTPKMRVMFYFLWLRSIGRNVRLTGRARELWERMPGGWKPLKDSTNIINIPPRPFIADVMDKPSVLQKARTLWRGAVARTAKQLLKG